MRNGTLMDPNPQRSPPIGVNRRGPMLRFDAKGALRLGTNGDDEEDEDDETAKSKTSKNEPPKGHVKEPGHADHSASQNHKK